MAEADAENQSVVIAVRVRPFNSREKDKDSELIIQMKNNTTIIRNPITNTTKQFTFDYSYWSHDGFHENEDGYLSDNCGRYTDQQKVFNDMGKTVLKNAWEGYNVSLFAYGQTGAGKSYSVVGYDANKGIIPLVCEGIFSDIEKRKEIPGNQDEFKVELSMVEVYNEKVRDLLSGDKMGKNDPGLKLREDRDGRFRATDLRIDPVFSYDHIEQLIDSGKRNRTVAATNMNETSSRAHTIVTVYFRQKLVNEHGESMSRVSEINLVDLAGSERAKTIVKWYKLNSWSSNHQHTSVAILLF